MTVAARLIEVTGAVAPYRSTNRGVDIARREAVASGSRAVDIDLDGRLAKRGKNREIGNPQMS
jgi:hypothetical protein